MRVFVTGATGWIGSATVDELIAAGHDVVGLARSDKGAAALKAQHATVLQADLDDLEALRRGATEADAVIHLANKHDFANPAESNRAERAAVETFTEALAGTNRPFVLASGLAGLSEGRPSTEQDPSPFTGPESARGGGENLALDSVSRGVRTIAARFAPTVHGTGDHGFIALIVAAARKHGVSAYIGEGTNAWSAVHRSDAARLVRLGLEHAPAGTRPHAAAEPGIPTREIAEAIGRTLGLPVTSVAPQDAVEHFGFIGRFFAMDMQATSIATRESLSWHPSGPTLIEDIEAGAYTRS
ncbi:SDR family oxidoreductase [Actinoplanes sp. TFC3]|uniref:SDR family oxidoreductase n=1 Tax=Actinoplanes sp. TFC3 TaxID=1710355 RepID=UPI00082A00D2|nr:SDR family oxidoreductase [Actinoplanes sp. TFC3]